ncbi:MAG: DUF3866 family protein [Coriobacteriia bacterium]|nr:DUF3866 family protein [Coriobacteriia bacterium]
MRLIWTEVTALGAAREGVQELETREGAALCYPALTGACAVGERVLVNTTARDLALGTGGVDFVVARAEAADGANALSSSPVSSCASVAGSRVALDESNTPADGHIMKLRYTPLQRNVLAVEAPESPYHKIMERLDTLEGIPVVCCGLHSQVPLVAAAIKQVDASLRVGYVMTDQAALPLAFSKLVTQCRDLELLDATLTCGQAFGGELEAVNLYSGLLAACHVQGCDVVIVSIGPGLAGTQTLFGHGGVAQGEAINATGALGGSPIACLRMSFADERQRHQGISHHSLTALGRIAAVPATAIVPWLEGEQQTYVEAQLESFESRADHYFAQLEQPSFSEDALRGLHVTTMGRGPAEDPAFFEAAFAAGAAAGGMARFVEPPSCVKSAPRLDLDLDE